MIDKPTDWEMTANPALRTPRYWAELAVDNGECGAQIEVHDRILRESLILNIETVIARAIKHAREKAE